MTYAFKSAETFDGVCSVPGNPQAIYRGRYTMAFDDPPDPVVQFPKDTPVFIPPLFSVGCALPDIEITDDRCRPGGVLHGSATVTPGVGDDPCTPAIKLDLHADLVCTSSVVSARVEKRLHPKAIPVMNVRGGATPSGSGECSSGTCIDIFLPDVTCNLPVIKTKRISRGAVAAEPAIRFDIVEGRRAADWFAPDPAPPAFTTDLSVTVPGVASGRYILAGVQDGHPTYSHETACDCKLTFDARLGKYVVTQGTGKVIAWGDSYVGVLYAYYPDNWCLPEDQTACEAMSSSSSCGPPALEAIGLSVAIPPDPLRRTAEAHVMDTDPCAPEWDLDILLPDVRCEIPEVEVAFEVVNHLQPPVFAVQAPTPRMKLLPVVGPDGFPVRDTEGNALKSEQPDPCSLKWKFDVKLPQPCVQLPGIVKNVTGGGTFDVSVVPGVAEDGSADPCYQTWQFDVQFPGLSGDSGFTGSLDETYDVVWQSPYLLAKRRRKVYHRGSLVSSENLGDKIILRGRNCA